MHHDFEEVERGEAAVEEGDLIRYGEGAVEEEEEHEDVPGLLGGAVGVDGQRCAKDCLCGPASHSGLSVRKLACCCKYRHKNIEAILVTVS